MKELKFKLKCDCGEKNIVIFHNEENFVYPPVCRKCNKNFEILEKKEGNDAT